MDKIRRIGAIVLALIAVILIITTVFSGDKAKIVGTWERNISENNSFIYEFNNDGSGVMYKSSAAVGPWDEQTFSYMLHSGNITLTYATIARTCPYELSGNTLTIDGTTYERAGGSIFPTLLKWFLIVALLVVAFILYKGNVIKANIKVDNEIVNKIFNNAENDTDGEVKKE